MTALFQRGNYVLSHREYSPYKIECDALTDEDFATCAMLIVERVPEFGAIYGIPRGGTPLARALEPYITEGPCLIVDDVWTSGSSMEGSRRGWEDVHPVMDPRPIGAVIFARRPVADWVTALFTLSGVPDA